MGGEESTETREGPGASRRTKSECFPERRDTRETMEWALEALEARVMAAGSLAMSGEMTWMWRRIWPLPSTRSDEGMKERSETGVGVVVEDEVLQHEGVDDGVVLQRNEVGLVALVLPHFDRILLVDDISVQKEEDLLRIAVVEHVVDGLELNKSNRMYTTNRCSHDQFHRQRIVAVFPLTLRLGLHYK